MQTTNTVQHLLKTPSGEIGGLLLGDGTIVDTPPHHGEALKAMLRRGDQVRVEGDARRSRRGRLHVQARSIAMPTHRKPPRQELIGTVQAYTRNRQGIVNGLRLANGTVVRTPSLESEKILAHIREGDTVSVVGRTKVSRTGQSRFVASRIRVHHLYENGEQRSQAYLSDLQHRMKRALDLLRDGEAILAELQEIRHQSRDDSKL